MANPVETKVKALEDVAAGKPRSWVARKYGIHPVTLRRWLRRYPKNPEGGFAVESAYRRPYNRLSPRIEQRIYLRKEREPGVTLEKARAGLKREGVDASPATIRRIWQDHGLIDDPLNRPVDEAKIPIEDRSWLRKARAAVDRPGGFKEAARLLNQVKVCPDLELLSKIPGRYLKATHRLHKLRALYRTETLPVFYRHARRVRQSLERKKYFHSMLQAGFIEASALTWLERPEAGLDLVEHLARTTPGPISRYFRFQLDFFKGQFLAYLLRSREALACARRCEGLNRTLNQYDLAFFVSILYSALGHYRKGKEVLEKAWKRFKPDLDSGQLMNYATYCAITGDYRSARGTIRKLSGLDEKYRDLYSVTRAFCEIGRGNLERALEFSHQAEAHSRREGFTNILQASILVQACVYSALGFKRDAFKVMKRILPLLARRKANQDYYVHAILTGEDRIPQEFLAKPTIRLLLDLIKAGRTGRSGDYNRAYRFAEKWGLLGVLHRFCLLAPEIVATMLRRARPTRLPGPILRLPLFARDLPKVRVDLLGKIRISREDRPLKVRVRPKDAAFLIHLLTARNSCLDVRGCLDNFWPGARAQKSNLYHLLRRLRRQLQIPPQYLYVKQGAVHYKGTYISDDNMFRESLSLAQALDRAGEWTFANREYQSAFRRFRGEPFRRLFDPWSDNVRTRILVQLEAAAIHYCDRCEANGALEDKKKVLKKTLAVIPGSEECRKRLTARPANL